MSKAEKFEVESLFHMKPRRELQRWVDGSEMKCPRCQQFVEEGKDCTNKDYLRLGDKLEALLERES